MSIYENLPEGAFNGLTASELMKQHNIKSQRDFYQIIHDERIRNKPILHKGNKYFRSEVAADFDPCIKQLVKIGLSNLEVARALMKARPDESGQLTMEDYIQRCSKELDLNEQEEAKICSEVV